MPSKLYLLLALFVYSIPCFSQTPDLILTNGKVFTSNEKQLYAEAIAIKGNRVIAVGSKTAIGSLAKPSTKIIDVEGRTIVPGFNDAHYHHSPIQKG